MLVPKVAFSAASLLESGTPEWGGAGKRLRMSNSPLDRQPSEEVEVYNDAGLYRVRVKHSSLVRPNQVVIYHCWEKYQLSKGHSHAVNPCVAKPLLHQKVEDFARLNFFRGLTRLLERFIICEGAFLQA